jgi:hypothetical protein
MNCLADCWCEGLELLEVDCFVLKKVEALRAAVNRLETDVLGLYDWTKQKVVNIEQEVTFATGVLKYFQQHAKILPKTS